MSDGIGAKLVKVIASHPDIREGSKSDRRLLKGIAAHMILWLCENQTQGWQPEHMKNIKYLYEIWNYHRNSCMTKILSCLANSAKAVDIATLFKLITDENEREAERAKENKEARVNYMRETAFYRAAKDGDTDEVKKLLDNPKIDGSDANKGGAAPLHHAAEHGHSVVVKLLLDKPDIDRNAADESGMALLHHAAKHGHSAAVKLLLSNPNIDGNAADERGMAPLHHAAKHGHLCVVLSLLANKVRIDEEDCQGKTALMYAILEMAGTKSSSVEGKRYDGILTALLAIGANH